MNPTTQLLEAWTWNPAVLAVAAAAALLYGWTFRGRARWGAFAGALALVLFTLLSPLNTLATGVLFSAHMAQHILLLLVVPALLLASLPRDLGRAPGPLARRWLPVLGWAGGVGSMWFWHVPELCDAAATNGAVHTVQTLSLLALGTTFWWPVFAPRRAHRLAPGPGIAYLFTACLACTALGIILTLTPVQVCPVFRAPLAAGAAWAALRDTITADRDQQIGGLLMWVPMCLVYVAAIIIELFRWFEGRDSPPAATQEARP